MYFGDLLLPILLFSVPIVGIAGWTIVRVAESIFGPGKLNKQETKLLVEKVKYLERENQDLQRRTENLEAIIANLDGELLEGFMKLQTHTHQDTSRVKQYAQFAHYQSNASNNQQSAFDKMEGLENVEKNIRIVLNKLLQRIENFIDEKPSEHKRF